MNLEDLKETWNEETIEQVPEVSLSEQKGLKNPLALIRKNMRMEFWTNNLVILLLIVGCFFYIENQKFLLYTTSLLLVVVLITGFYFLKFKKIYNEIGNTNYSTFQSLLELNYRLEYFKNLFFSLYMSLVPIILCELFLMYEFYLDFSQKPIGLFIITWIASFIISTLFIYFYAKFWFSSVYGKHIAKISNLLHEIKHPYEDFDTKIIKVDEKKYWYSKTEEFFSKRMGVFGKILNAILWILGLLVIVFVTGFIVGLTIAYFTH